jgi:hypothetical protein
MESIEGIQGSAVDDRNDFPFVFFSLQGAARLKRPLEGIDLVVTHEGGLVLCLGVIHQIPLKLLALHSLLEQPVQAALPPPHVLSPPARRCTPPARSTARCRRRLGRGRGGDIIIVTNASRRRQTPKAPQHGRRLPALPQLHLPVNRPKVVVQVLVGLVRRHSNVRRRASRRRRQLLVAVDIDDSLFAPRCGALWVCTPLAACRRPRVAFRVLGRPSSSPENGLITAGPGRASERVRERVHHIMWSLHLKTVGGEFCT